MDSLSLILVTRGRTRETARFFRSLHEQRVAADIVLVDQNEDDRLDAILAQNRPPFELMHLRSGPGLSHGRNVGLPHARGSIIAFPDDDCAYPPGMLERVSERLANRPDLDGVTGRAEDEQGRPMLRFPDRPLRLRRTNVGRCAVSCTIFLRRRVIDAVGDFDETLGPGAGTAWTAADETDYLFRALALGFVIEYQPDLVVRHPYPMDRSAAELRVRAAGYGRANGRVWRRHGLPLLWVARGLIGPALRSGLQRMRGRSTESAYHWQTFRGRLAGWLGG